jgi:hypothetical protein
MKCELVYHERYEDHQDTLHSIFEYIEVFYNMEFVVPTGRFFEILSEYERFFKPYKISHIETTKDTFGNSTHENNKIVSDRLKLLNKKYTTDHKIYKRSYEDEINNVDKRLIGNKTGYHGSDKFKHVTFCPKIFLSTPIC